MSAIANYLTLVRTGVLIANITLDNEAIAALVDARDSSDFDARWMKAFEGVERAKSHMFVDAATNDLVAEAREAAYLQAFERWQSPDLAAYISDDVGLIGDALTTEYVDPWLNGLLRGYLRGHFPSGEIVKIEGEATEILDQHLPD